MEVLAYTRVSTAEQEDSGAGIAAQRTAILAECERRGWTIVAWHTDTASGRSTNGRPGLHAALEALDHGEAQALVASKLDRLSRSVSDFAELLKRAVKRGWAVVVLDLGVDTTTPTGKAMAQIMAVLAEWEREVIGQRTKDALAEKRAQGVKLGRPRSVPEKVQRRVLKMRERGDSWARIVDQLNNAGVPTGQGGVRWYPASARRVALRS